MANARMKYRRKGTSGSGKSEMLRDPGKHHVPGFLGREKVRPAQGRTGYTEEKRLGPGGRGRNIPLPKGG
jgi:hypothetical protein